MKDSWSLNIHFDAKQAEKEFRQLGQKAVPKALADTLNHLAFGGRKQLQDSMTQIFDRPTPWTLGLFRIKRARPSNLEAQIATVDNFQKGTGASRYLSPQVFGGPRDMKRSEKALRTLSGGQYWLPGKDAPLDQYGNIRGGEITRILSRMGLMLDPTANYNPDSPTSKRMRKRRKNARGQQHEYFIAREKSGNRRPIGIYKYSGTSGKVLQILRFTPKQPAYRLIFPAQQILNDYVSRNAERVVMKSLETFSQKVFK